MKDYEVERRLLVEELAQRGVRDQRVLEAIRQVPRHLFVPAHAQAQAYGDFALPIGHRQTISQPYVVARMTELLGVEPHNTVLEIGTGSGYQTAILAHLARRVYSLERIPELAREAIQRMRDLGLHNVKIQVLDGTTGWRQAAPFDRILVTAGAPNAPEPLLEQLAVGGRMVIPEGPREAQRLVTYERTARALRRREGEAVAFVPLVGRHGWSGE